MAFFRMGLHGERKIVLNEVHEHLLCMLCGGYLVDATTINRCLHSFCRACILHHLQVSVNCPVCDVTLNADNIHSSLRPDVTLQMLAYKLVPNLYANEVKRRKDFEESAQATEATAASKQNGGGSGTSVVSSLMHCRSNKFIYSTTDKFSIGLQHRERSTVKKLKSSKLHVVPKKANENCRYLLCPAAMTVKHLKKFISLKFDLTCRQKVQLYHSGECLNDNYSLMDIAYIFTWRKDSSSTSTGYRQAILRECSHTRGPLLFEYLITNDSLMERRRLEQPTPVVHGGAGGGAGAGGKRNKMKWIETPKSGASDGVRQSAVNQTASEKGSERPIPGVRNSAVGLKAANKGTTHSADISGKSLLQNSAKNNELSLHRYSRKNSILSSVEDSFAQRNSRLESADLVNSSSSNASDIHQCGGYTKPDLEIDSGATQFAEVSEEEKSCGVLDEALLRNIGLPSTLGDLGWRMTESGLFFNIRQPGVFYALDQSTGYPMFGVTSPQVDAGGISVQMPGQVCSSRLTSSHFEAFSPGFMVPALQPELGACEESSQQVGAMMEFCHGVGEYVRSVGGGLYSAQTAAAKENLSRLDFPVRGGNDLFIPMENKMDFLEQNAVLQLGERNKFIMTDLGESMQCNSPSRQTNYKSFPVRSYSVNTALPECVVAPGYTAQSLGYLAKNSNLMRESDLPNFTKESMLHNAALACTTVSTDSRSSVGDSGVAVIGIEQDCGKSVSSRIGKEKSNSLEINAEAIRESFWMEGCADFADESPIVSAPNRVGTLANSTPTHSSVGLPKRVNAESVLGAQKDFCVSNQSCITESNVESSVVNRVDCLQTGDSETDQIVCTSVAGSNELDSIETDQIVCTSVAGSNELDSIETDQIVCTSVTESNELDSIETDQIVCSAVENKQRGNVEGNHVDNVSDQVPKENTELETDQVAANDNAESIAADHADNIIAEEQSFPESQGPKFDFTLSKQTTRKLSISEIAQLGIGSTPIRDMPTSDCSGLGLGGLQFLGIFAQAADGSITRIPIPVSCLPESYRSPNGIAEGWLMSHEGLSRQCVSQVDAGGMDTESVRVTEGSDLAVDNVDNMLIENKASSEQASESNSELLILNEERESEGNETNTDGTTEAECSVGGNEAARNDNVVISETIENVSIVRSDFGAELGDDIIGACVPVEVDSISVSTDETNDADKVTKVDDLPADVSASQSELTIDAKESDVQERDEFSESKKENSHDESETDNTQGSVVSCDGAPDEYMNDIGNVAANCVVALSSTSLSQDVPLDDILSSSVEQGHLIDKTEELAVELHSRVNSKSEPVGGVSVTQSTLNSQTADLSRTVNSQLAPFKRLHRRKPLMACRTLVSSIEEEPARSSSDGETNNVKLEASVMSVSRMASSCSEKSSASSYSLNNKCDNSDTRVSETVTGKGSSSVDRDLRSGRVLSSKDDKCMVTRTMQRRSNKMVSTPAKRARVDRSPKRAFKIKSPQLKRHAKLQLSAASLALKKSPEVIRSERLISDPANPARNLSRGVRSVTAVNRKKQKTDNQMGSSLESVQSLSDLSSEPVTISNSAGACTNQKRDSVEKDPVSQPCDSACLPTDDAQFVAELKIDLISDVTESESGDVNCAPSPVFGSKMITGEPAISLGQTTAVNHFEVCEDESETSLTES